MSSGEVAYYTKLDHERYIWRDVIHHAAKVRASGYIQLQSQTVTYYTAKS